VFDAKNRPIYDRMKKHGKPKSTINWKFYLTIILLIFPLSVFTSEYGTKGLKIIYIIGYAGIILFGACAFFRKRKAWDRKPELNRESNDSNAN
jgi:hypothetical protein